MPVINVKLIKKETVAEGTMAFHFAKPDGLEFKAGQFADYTLINPAKTDDEGNTRGFSLVQAPFEGDLVVATRMRDTAFKQTLKDLPLGTEVKFDGPYGDFTLHNNTEKPAVFLIGGIGITPVRSILAQASHDKLPHKLYLFYSNRRPEDTAFLSDLQEFARQNPNFSFIPTMTDMTNSQQPWTGETGFISGDMIKKYVPDLTTPRFYLAGPATMVAAMRKVLTEAQVDEDNIKTEEFSGY
jgi:ferredoxin-NADP reductase